MPTNNKKEIKLNKEVSMDIPKLIEGGMVILANSGGGKSYAIRRIAEEAVNQIQTIIIDPEGEFASLREKYDFILAGKDADVPAEPRSAGLLAIKLLELGKSAVIDLYELHPQERQRFVKIFCDAMVNCPKELYHPVLIVLDEAHEYVPEGKPSEATWAVESLASKGRKRGQRLILASQRISKLSKNAAAECNNKLIGRASQDIDMKRAGDELGFSKESLKSLRQLKPGEFFAFGPAISDEVILLKIGEVKTAHAKVGYHGTQKTPPASAVIKAVLAELKDLPQEAEKEAKTISELKKENTELKRKNTLLEKNPTKSVDGEMIKKAVEQAEKKMQDQFWKEREEWMKQIQNWFSILENIGKTMTEFTSKRKVFKVSKEVFKDVKFTPMVDVSDIKKSDDLLIIGGPERKILNAIAWMESVGITEPAQTAVAFIAGYTYGGGAFNNPRGALRVKGLVQYVGDKISLTETGRANAVYPENTSTTEELHEKIYAILPGPERRLLQAIIEAYPESLTVEELAERTGYTAGGGALNNPKGRLRTLGLIKYPSSGRVMAEDLLFI